MVVALAAVHLTIDLTAAADTGAFPAGIPVALLIVPVGYAALRYGLVGSAATGAWATLLWLPDLLLPHDQGHVGADLVNLALVDLVALFSGLHIDSERRARRRVERVTTERLAVETGYRRLFETNRAPILVLGSDGVVMDANPAARQVFGAEVIGRRAPLPGHGQLVSEAQDGRVLRLSDGRDYRVGSVALPAGGPDASAQVVLEDVTAERDRGRRATRFAAMVVQAEEEQRRRLARELHDEPLQLFLHLARRLDDFVRSGVAPDAAQGLEQARAQALEAAGRLRDLASGLRPPALDQLGLRAALSSLLADVEVESSLATTLTVTGVVRRLSPEVELGAFRIAQEALRNVVRHARASQVELQVGFGADELVLCVVDDGGGFAPEQLAEAPTEHLGLLGMSERARLLGGSLAVRSAPGRGTRVEATVPLAVSCAVPR